MNLLLNVRSWVRRDKLEADLKSQSFTADGSVPLGLLAHSDGNQVKELGTDRR